MNISTLLRAAPVGRRTFGLLALLKAVMPVDSAAHQAATSPLNLKRPPTPAQARAGNYAKGHTKVAGIPITIENPAGTRRKPHHAPMTAHYGYIRRTTGADGDHVDVFVRPSTANDWVGDVYVINQADASGERFDEHKVMVGWPDERSAVRAYLGNYPRGWKLGPVVTMSSAEFRAWVRDGDHTAPLRKYSEDQPRDEQGRWTDAGDESGAGTVGAGDKFVVYRLGQKNGDLNNRNAGNADAVAMHMVRMADETGAVSVGGVGDHVTAYEVTIGQSGVGPYEAHSAGHGGKETRVGRTVAGRSKNEVAYSFPKNGDFTARQLASVSVRDLNAMVGHGMNFDDAGSIRGAEILRDVFKPTKKVSLLGLLRKYSDDQPRDEQGRWTDGGGGDSSPPELSASQVVPKGLRDAVAKLESENAGHEGDVAASLTQEQKDQATKELAASIKGAHEDKPAFDTRLHEIAKDVNGTPKTAPVKGGSRLLEKHVLENASNPQEMRDLVRGSIIVNSPEDAARVLDHIKNEFEVTRVKDRFAQPLPTGYRDMLVNVRLPSGIQGEIQVHVPEMIAAKELGHRVYNIERSTPPGAEKSAMVTLQTQIYGSAIKANKERTGG